MSSFAHRSITIFAVFGITVLLSASTAAWDWDFEPNPPTSGSDMTITVDEAPGFPVLVEIYVGGEIYRTEKIGEPGDSVTITLPTNSTGQSFGVTLRGGGTTSARGGTIH